MSLTETNGLSKKYALFDDGNFIRSGELGGTEYLATSLAVVANEDDNAFIGALPAAAFPALPDSGHLEEGEIYQWNNQAVQVRQSHDRTIYTPDQTPALFLMYREGAGTLEWIAGESVAYGTLRMYNDVTYRCVQAHVTQADWTPDATPTLWQEYDPTPAIAEWVQPTGAHDAYILGAKVTHNGHLWESLYPANVWEPGVFGWTDLGVYP